MNASHRSIILRKRAVLQTKPEQYYRYSLRYGVGQKHLALYQRTYE